MWFYKNIIKVLLKLKYVGWMELAFNTKYKVQFIFITLFCKESDYRVLMLW